MPGLADIQAAVRDALVRGDRSAAAPMLSGGARPEHRLAIHQRHYAASLTGALLDRFPATVWLVGSDLVTDAATSFIREQPPSKPCIAEYGELFPQHLGAHPAAGHRSQSSPAPSLPSELSRPSVPSVASPPSPTEEPLEPEKSASNRRRRATTSLATSRSRRSWA